MIALLFDFASMTPEQQARARQAAIVYATHNPDAFAVFSTANGKVSVAQDYTSDPVLLEAAILRLAPGAAGPVEIESAANILALLPPKKMLLYYSAPTSAPPGDAGLQKAIAALQKANTAIFPIVTAPDGNLASLPRPESYLGVPSPGQSGLPARHASFRTQMAAELQTLNVPVDTLSGSLDITALIRTAGSSGNQTAAALRDTAQASSGDYQARFTLKPGTYICYVGVKEQSTGRTFHEDVAFSIK